MRYAVIRPKRLPFERVSLVKAINIFACDFVIWNTHPYCLSVNVLAREVDRQLTYTRKQTVLQAHVTAEQWISS